MNKIEYYSSFFHFNSIIILSNSLVIDHFNSIIITSDSLVINNFNSIIIQHTLRQKTQLDKSTIHYPMRRHFKSRFQMLRYKRLNEVIDTDTYFGNEKSIERYHCAQVFFGMISKMLYVAGMKTESEFADVYLDFIRKCGIPSALRRDNAKSEMSQRVKDIHRDLIIADQWIEPHSPWQNPAELNGVKYLKSHAQVLLDRTDAPDNLWFLAAEEYSSHVHNLSANRQLN
jgi:hypothetical protein